MTGRRRRTYESRYSRSKRRRKIEAQHRAEQQQDQPSQKQQQPPHEQQQHESLSQAIQQRQQHQQQPQEQQQHESLSQAMQQRQQQQPPQQQQQHESSQAMQQRQQHQPQQQKQQQQQQRETTCIDNIHSNIVQNDSLPTIRLSQQPSTSNAGLMFHNGNADRCRKYGNNKKLQQQQQQQQQQQGETTCTDNIHSNIYSNIVQTDSLPTIPLSQQQQQQQQQKQEQQQQQQQQRQTTCIDNIHSNIVQNDSLPTIRFSQQPSTSNAGLMFHNGNADRCRRYRNKKKLQQHQQHQQQQQQQQGETTCIDNTNIIQDDSLSTIRLSQQPSTSNADVSARTRSKKRKESSANIENLENLEQSKRNRTTSLQNNGIGTETLPQSLTSDHVLQVLHSAAFKYFNKMFTDNFYGLVCYICDRLWFKNDLRAPSISYRPLILQVFPNASFSDMLVCNTCHNSLIKNTVPSLSKSNGFTFPPIPIHLPKLDLLTERLVSPRLPFMQIRRLRHGHGQYGIIGQVINVPVSVNNMVTSLPRNIDDDYCINVHIKRRSIHKTSYICGLVQKRNLKSWLQFLLATPLYKHYNITINPSFLNSYNDNAVPCSSNNNNVENVSLDDFSEIISMEESLVAQQQTMLWSEEMYLPLAPGERNKPISLLFDEHAEELSFPSIYAGQFRIFKEGLKVTPFMMATSELRRADRRAATPQHILFMAMKIMRLKTRDSLTVAFKNIGRDSNITRAQIESPEYINNCIDKNLAFLRSIPNSSYYWQKRKRDLFAMMRQFGKPDMFLTMSANEIGWDSLLQTLYSFHNRDHISKEEVANLNYMIKSALVNEDPTSCALYFNKLIDTILTILQSKKFSPFGKYYVVHYFKRIEFQHRGSPHAHILLWLNSSPKDPLGANKEEAISMIDTLISVSNSDASGHIKLQTHKHTFTCYKRIAPTRKQECRFEAPFMPCRWTIILTPMSTDDARFKNYKKHYKQIRLNLENNDYPDLNTFLKFNNISSYDHYIDILSAGIKRPKVFLKRRLSEKWTNPYNPFIFNVLKSNMDLQFITEEYSCATYVVEYVNKTNRGISDLQRRIIEVMNEFPDFDVVQITRKLSIDMLNAVEISSQESAYYLLRLPMSKSSELITFIPTMWPIERDRLKKTAKEIEDLDEDSTDIWKHNYFDKYERRPSEFDNLSLAQFVALYNFCEKTKKITKRRCPRVIRYRNYDPTQDINEYKREMVTLYIPFRNEEQDVLSEMKFVNIYDENENVIMERRKEFEYDLDIAKIIEICKNLCQNNSDSVENEPNTTTAPADEDHFRELYNNNGPINDDLTFAILDKLGPIAKRRENIMPNEEFYNLMSQANHKQLSLLTHVINHLTTNTNEPFQIFLTGPAGCGKTFVIRLLMEIYNRFTNSDNFCNAFITCASTGKAAVAINGCTVHTALRISITTKLPLSSEIVQLYRTLFKFVKVIIIDEVSMVSAELLHQIDARLKQITGHFDLNFGGLDIILIGDLRQLPPVRATPIFKQIKQKMIGSTLWRDLRFHELTQVMRQSNVIFSNILTKIGSGESLTKQEQDLISSRMFTKEMAKELCPNGVRLFLQNNSVSEYNSMVLNEAENKINSIGKDIITGCTNAEQEAGFRQKLHKKSVIDTGGLPYELPLVIGKPYLITTNIDVSDGLSNGALGRLTLIEFDDDGGVTRLWLQFPEYPNIGLKIRKKVASYIQAQNIHSSAVPLARKNSSIPLNLNKTIVCKRNHFPLIPACAMTIHKSQGGTFEEVVYEYERSHIRSLLYVALSRVTSIDGLYITTAKNDNKFYHGTVTSTTTTTTTTTTELKNEFSRLALNTLETLQTKLIHFINENKDFCLFSFNCQSLRAHCQHLSDSVVNACTFLLLSETWLHSDEQINIPNFDCIIKYKRENIRSGGVAIYRHSSNNPEVLINISTHQNNSVTVNSSSIGDICSIQCQLRNGQEILLSVIYISPNHTAQEIIDFIHFMLLPYSIAGSDLLNKQYKNMPMILCGDFNINFSSEAATPLIEFLRDKFSLKLNSDVSLATTRSGTTIDAVFQRYLNSLKSQMYTSYFSYHKPIITCKPIS